VVEDGDSILIGGFILQGGATQKLLFVPLVRTSPAEASRALYKIQQSNSGTATASC
jgi:hypothetical protein